MAKLINRKRKNRLDKLLEVDDPVFDENFRPKHLSTDELIRNVEEKIGFNKYGLMKVSSESDDVLYSISLNALLSAAYFRTGNLERSGKILDNIFNQEDPERGQECAALAFAYYVRGEKSKGTEFFDKTLDKYEPLGLNNAIMYTTAQKKMYAFDNAIILAVSYLSKQKIDGLRLGIMNTCYTGNRIFRTARDDESYTLELIDLQEINFEYILQLLGIAVIKIGQL